MYDDLYITGETGDKTSLYSFLADHWDALYHAAELIGGRRGAALVGTIRDGIEQSGPLTRRIRHALRDLCAVLHLEHVDDPSWECSAAFELLHPDDPVVTDICLLADGLSGAMAAAGMFQNTLASADDPLLLDDLVLT